MARIRTVYRDREIGGHVPDDPDVLAEVPIRPDATTAVEADDPLDKVLAEMPPLAADWLRAHPQYLHDADENARITALHHELIGEGVEAYSAPYFAEIEQRLEQSNGTHSNADPIPAEAEEFETPHSRIRVSPKRVQVSAPPSRGGMGSIVESYLGGRDYDMRQGRITLTAEQKHFARIAGVDDRTYAENLIKLRERKAMGDYGGQ
jgi:hypothetical protein